MHEAGDRNHRVVVARLSQGTVGAENFGADTTAVPTPGPGQFLSRTLYLSLDPLYRIALQGNGDASHRLNPGDVISGETVAQVVESQLANVHVADAYAAGLRIPEAQQQVGRRRLSRARSPD